MTGRATRRARRRDRRRAQRGLTIIELLVAMTLVSILVGAAMQIAVVVLSGYKIHRDAIGAQRAARGSLDLIADAVRNASAGVPTGNVTDAAGCTPFIGLDVVNHTDRPDELSVTTAAGGVFSSLRATFDDNSSTLSVLDGAAFAAGDLVLITDFEQGHVVKITDVVEGSDAWLLTIEPTCSGVTFAYSAGALAIRARVSRFYIDEVDGTPTLMLDGDGDGPEPAEPLAEGVEDFQVAVGIDANGDGDVHDEGDAGDDWHYNDPADAAPAAVTATPWRALRLTVVARSLVEEPGEPISSPPAVEDHAGGSPDGFRRRAISTIVEIRNLDGSP